MAQRVTREVLERYLQIVKSQTGARTLHFDKHAGGWAITDDNGRQYSGRLTASQMLLFLEGAMWAGTMQGRL